MLLRGSKLELDRFKEIVLFYLHANSIDLILMGLPHVNIIAIIFQVFDLYFKLLFILILETRKQPRLLPLFD